MSAGIEGLVNNITDSAKSLGRSLGILKKSGGTLYPDSLPVLSKINPANWNKNAPYSFVILPSLQGFAEFVLPLGPSELSQDEDIAVSFKTTQGGTVTQHGGLRYKDLTISGTTGIAPFRGAGGVSHSTGKAIFQPDDLKHSSGYEVFQSLRNWFKAYYHIKATATDDETRNATLVFKNLKDGEFLVVELVKLSLKRSASRKYLYDYVLNFRVLGHYAVTDDSAKSLLGKVDNFVQGAKDKIDFARGVFLRSQDMLRQIEGTYDSTVLEPLRKAALAAKAFLGIKFVAADMGKRIISNTVTEAATLGLLLGIAKKSTGAPNPLIQKALDRAQNQSRVGASSAATSKVFAGLLDSSDLLMGVDASAMPAASQAALTQELASVQALPRSYYEAALKDIKRVRDNAIDKFNLGSPVYDAQVGRVSTATVDSGKIATDAEIELLDGFANAIKGLENLISSNTLFTGTYQDRIQNVQNAFTEALPIKAERAVKQVPLGTHTDLERLALTYLGNSSRWIEIAELNDLKPPYIIQDQSDQTPNVLHPGDQVLIPTPPVNGFSKTPKGKPSYYTESLSEIEKNLGVDLKLTPDFDLSLSNRGDLEVVSGAKNAAQAIMLKLMIEPGELLKHPKIGVGLLPGNKFPSLTDIHLTLVQSLSQDPRFENVQNIQIIQDGSALLLNFEIKVKHVDIPIPLSVKL